MDRLSQKPHPMMGELYRRAKALLRGEKRRFKPKPGEKTPAMDAQRLLHELQVHQVELELQNDELQESRDRMETLLANYTDLYDFAPLGYLSLDESGVILEANLTGASLLGVERSLLVNRRLLFFLAAASRPLFLSFLKNIFTDVKDSAYEALIVKQGGRTFWAAFHATSAPSLKGKRRWCRVAFADITDRKKSEEALRVSEKRYRTLFELVPAAVYSCDASGVIQEFNQRAVELWGREPVSGDTNERFCGSFKMFRPDGTFTRHEQCPMSLVVGGKLPAVHDREVILERPDGSRITVIVNIRPLKNEQGKGSGAINCFYDITARKREEEAQRRIEVLAASNQKLEQEIIRRQAVEDALKKSEQHQKQLLDREREMGERLGHLSRRVLSAQEDERKKISIELHDVIAQTLLGINVQLENLKKGPLPSLNEMGRRIARTQRLVEQSVNTVHQFARELRPAVLDDLGLIPALNSFMKSFIRRTGIQVSLKTSRELQPLDPAHGTVLYRIVQESLVNVGLHAHATQVEVSINRLADCLCLRVEDNGKGFHPEGLLRGKKGQRLGLLGMNERLEMVNGSLTIKSAPGKGTTIEARIPLANSRPKVAPRPKNRWSFLRSKTSLL